MKARMTAKVFIFSIPDILPVAIFQLLLLRMTGARLIFVVHDPLPHAWRLPAQLRRLEKFGHQLTYMLANQLVVLSEPSKRALQNAFPAVPTPITIIEHALYAVPKPPAIPGSRKLLLFGTLRQNKGVLEAMQGVVQANQAHINVQLVVAGAAHRDEAAYAAAIKSFAATAPHVIDLQIGFVSDEILDQLIADCDAFLMPYGDFDSQSGVAMLAVSNSRPIIATKVGGIGALINDGMPAITIPSPTTGQQIARAIQQYYEISLDDWQHRSTAYHIKMMQTHSWAAIGKQYAELAGSLAR